MNIIFHNNVSNIIHISDQISLIFAYSDTALLLGISLFIRIIIISYVMCIPLDLIPTSTFPRTWKKNIFISHDIIKIIIFITIIHMHLAAAFSMAKIGM